MPYNNERASRLGHSRIVLSEAVQAVMNRWMAPASTVDTAAIEQRLISLDDLAPDPHTIKFAVALDGSEAELPLNRSFPAVTIGFIQIAAALVNLDAFFQSADTQFPHFVDPRKIRASQTTNAVQAVLPGAVIRAKEGSLTGIQTWRYEVDQLLKTAGIEQPDGGVYSLERALMTLHGSLSMPVKTIKLHKCPECEQRDDPVLAPGECPRCGAPVYPSDVLRAHEEFNEHGSNMQPMTRIMNASERLLLMATIEALRDYEPALLSSMLFIQDGPLAFFGGTAPLRSEMSRYWGDLVSSLKFAGLPAPLLCGIEKSGVFVEHAKAISEFIPRKTLMTLDNQYIRERIQAQDPSSVYGKQEFYGRRFFYRTSSGQMLVVTLPRADGGQPYNPSESLASVDVSKYPTLRPCLEELDRLQTRMYADAVIPVALAHDATSIPLRIGGHVLTLLAQEALGLRRAGQPVSGP